MSEQRRKSFSRRKFIVTSGMGAAGLVGLAACGDATSTSAQRPGHYLGRRGW